MTEAATKTPAHLWIVGIASLLWNAFGAFDYTMTKTHNAAYLALYKPEQIAWYDNIPLWANAGWAFGVWGAVAGSILLLMRSRHAVTAFALSLAGLAVSTIFQQWVSNPSIGEIMATDKDGNALVIWPIAVAIWVVAIALLLYANWAKRKGVLH